MKQLDQNPINVRQEILTLGKLTAEDMQTIRLRKSGVNKLGFGYQLAFVKIRNYLPKQVPLEVDVSILDFVAYQLNLSIDLIKQYQCCRSVVRDHQKAIKKYLGFCDYDAVAIESLKSYLLEQAQQTDQLSLLVPKAQCFLRSQNILQPSLSTLRRLAGTCRNDAWELIEHNIVSLLTSNTKDKIQALLETNINRSILWQLRQPPGLPSTDSMKVLINKLQSINNTDILGLELSWLNSNYSAILAKKARYYSITQFKQLSEGKRYAILICFCRQLYEETVDHVIEMLIKLFDKAEKSSNKQIDAAARQKRQQIKKSLEDFQMIGALILNHDISAENLRDRIYDAIPKKQLEKQVASTQQWLSSKYSHVFRVLGDKYAYFRKFFPLVIENIDLVNDGTLVATQILEAITILKKLNRDENNQCPDDVPTEFIPTKLLKFITNDKGSIDRHAWEIAVLTSIRDNVKEGNLSANHGRFFCQFDKLFMPNTHWNEKRSDFFQKASLPVKASDIPQYLTERLHKAIDDFVRQEENNYYAYVDNGKWILSVDEAYQLSDEDEIALMRLKEFLKQHMRQIKLPDLLVEIDNDLHITNYFMTYEQRRTRDKDAIVTIIATWMAWGCGIGLTAMPKLVEGITYNALKSISDFALANDDLVRYTLADVVNAISELDITGNWGIGLSSGSDSIRMEYHSKVLNRGYSTCFGDYAIEFYTYVADTYAPFFSKPIECTNRDAGHVLDGILYNETSLPLLDHYVDTHGYTEISFTGFAMFGKQLNPRIKNVKSQRLYNIDPEYPFGSLAPLLKGTQHQIDMDCIVDQYDRMGQFYASMEMGYSTASSAMRRLVTFSDKNYFYKANRDFGRILKTENILKHMTDPILRDKRRRGLLKTEQLHQLSRDVAFGKHGKITGRDIWQLKNSCNCLTLIDACIVYWQAKEMMRVCQECRPLEQGINLYLLKHVSPIGWSNLILYGEYFIRKSLIK